MIQEIYIGADHAGFEMKEAIVEVLTRKGYMVHDLGAYQYDEDDDYPEYIASVARVISTAATDPDPEVGNSLMGIVIGGSGQGEAIMANRFPHVRAVVFNGQYEPQDGREVPDEIAISRQHNNANILSLGARFLSIEEAIEVTERWLEIEFSGDERHIRRLAKIEAIDQSIHNHEHDHTDNSGAPLFE